MQRCELLRASAAALGLALLPGRPRAGRYPSRPVRLLVGFPAGSASDARARLAAQHLGAALTQPFVVENLPGNAATLAAASPRAPRPMATRCWCPRMGRWSLRRWSTRT